MKITKNVQYNLKLNVIKITLMKMKNCFFIVILMAVTCVCHGSIARLLNSSSIGICFPDKFVDK